MRMHPDALFMGIGKSSVLWSRCALPAMHLGADWVGVRGQPPDVQVLTGIVRGETQLPRYNDYRVVVIQQPYGRAWLRQINALRARGIKVLYEIDDYLHGVAKTPLHDYAKYFTPQRLAAHELCMRACDGIIVSTDYIARRYAKFNRNVYVCHNGLDVARYHLTRPERSTVNIGWAGATGHMRMLVPWINETLTVMREHPDTCFIAIGEPGVAAPINQLLGGERALGIPFCPLECYPAAMCMLDIALAPAGQSAWYRAKSDLRWLEASALGIPVIADPTVYAEIEDGVTGFTVATPRAMADVLRVLVETPELRWAVGQEARAYVYEHRTSVDAALQWAEVFDAVVGEHESIHQLRRPA
jgi:Glycosyl transferases group 1